MEDISRENWERARQRGRERGREGGGERPKQTKQQKIGLGYEMSPERARDRQSERDTETQRDRGVCGEGARRGCMAHALHAFAKQ